MRRSCFLFEKHDTFFRLLALVAPTLEPSDEFAQPTSLLLTICFFDTSPANVRFLADVDQLVAEAVANDHTRVQL